MHVFSITLTAHQNNSLMGQQKSIPESSLNSSALYLHSQLWASLLAFRDKKAFSCALLGSRIGTDLLSPGVDKRLSLFLLQSPVLCKACELGSQTGLPRQ